MRLSELVQRVEGISCTDFGEDPEIAGVEFDSRLAGPGDLFVALVGAASDGHSYGALAVENGAAALLVQHTIDLDVPQIVVEDTRAALGPVAAAVFGHPSLALKVVGFTGTNGKTTSTYILESVLRAAGRSSGVMGTVAYRWGEVERPAPNTTPESALVQRLLREMVDDGVDTVAMEVSSHGLSTHRLEGTFFDVGVFTNLSQDHLDFHGSMEAYREAKFRLFTKHLHESASQGKLATAVINVDSGPGQRLAKLVKPLPIRLLTFGMEREATVRYEILDETILGSRVRCWGPWGRPWDFALGLLGAFNVENAVAVATAAHAMGIDPAAIRAGLESPELFVPGRMQRVGSQPRVFVDYAHTPDALSRACATLRPVAERLVVVFGAGGERDAQKRPVMGAIASEIADLAIVTSDNPRRENPLIIIGEILGGMKGTAEVLAESDRREAIRLAIREAGPEGVVLIAGKGHETYQEINGEQLRFDDVEEARLAMEAL